MGEVRALSLCLRGFSVERVTGIEPALSAWEADVLPLNYTRVGGHPPQRMSMPPARGDLYGVWAMVGTTAALAAWPETTSHPWAQMAAIARSATSGTLRSSVLAAC